MKLLVIGSNGQLGWELAAGGARNGFSVRAVDVPDIDITDRTDLAGYMEETKPDLVINAAAYTQVDKAESEVETAFDVNANGPGFLASACQKSTVPLIHVSTDYVFDGDQKTPYLETDAVRPIGVYGKSKAEGEKRVRNRLKRHVILRTAWLYGVHGHNFVKTMLRLGTKMARIEVVCDQYGCPTFARDLADAILTIAGRYDVKGDIPWGTYHFCGRGRTSWHGFAEAVFSKAAPYLDLAVKSVMPIPTEKYPTKAKRPKHSVLDCRLLSKCFDIRPKPWKESLQIMLDELLTAPDMYGKDI